jgi:hypothetical protein
MSVTRIPDDIIMIKLPDIAKVPCLYINHKLITILFDAAFTFPGWPLYEKPGLNKDISGVINDTKIIKIKIN